VIEFSPPFFSLFLPRFSGPPRGKQRLYARFLFFDLSPHLEAAVGSSPFFPFRPLFGLFSGWLQRVGQMMLPSLLSMTFLLLRRARRRESNGDPPSPPFFFSIFFSFFSSPSHHMERELLFPPSFPWDSPPFFPVENLTKEIEACLKPPPFFLFLFPFLLSLGDNQKGSAGKNGFLVPPPPPCPPPSPLNGWGMESKASGRRRSSFFFPLFQRLFLSRRGNESRTKKICTFLLAPLPFFSPLEIHLPPFPHNAWLTIQIDYKRQVFPPFSFPLFR